MRHRVIYDDEKVIDIINDDKGITYTSGNVLCGDIKKIGVTLRMIGIDTKMIEDYEAGLISAYDYQYVIIPTDLIPELVNMSGLVDDVLTGDEFTFYLKSIEITTGNGKKKGVKTLPVSFTPCTVIEWEEGDDERLQLVIDMFNAIYNQPREIDFPCKFDNRMALDDFIVSVKN